MPTDVPGLLSSVGPPGEWSGAVAGTVSQEQRQDLLRAWRSMSAEERNTIVAKWRERFNAPADKTAEVYSVGSLRRGDTGMWTPAKIHALADRRGVRGDNDAKHATLPVSKEHLEAARRVDAHFRSSDPKKWDTLMDNVQRKSFVAATKADVRADPKFERHVDQMGRLLTGKTIGKVGQYDIIRMRGGGTGCTCPDWRYKKSVAEAGEQDCKHIVEFKAVKSTKTASTRSDAFIKGADTAEEGHPGKDVVKGIGAIGVGGVLGRRAHPHLTGRQTIYHGTTAHSAEKIRRGGLLPSNKGGIRGIILEGGFPSEWADHAYVSTSKAKAHIYGAQAARMRPDEGGATILKASVPTWKPGLRLQQNPETAGGFHAWRDRTKARVIERRDAYKARYRAVPEMVERVEREAQATLNTLEHPVASRLLHRAQAYGEHAVDSVPAEYFHGAPNYKRLGLKEVSEYARARPGRFAGGALAAAGALGLGAYGVKKLWGAAHHAPEPAEGKIASVLTSLAAHPKGLFAAGTALGLGALSVGLHRNAKSTQFTPAQKQMRSLAMHEVAGLGMLASPYAASLASAGAEALSRRPGRVGVAARAAHSVLEPLSHAMHGGEGHSTVLPHANELLGLGLLVRPSMQELHHLSAHTSKHGGVLGSLR